MAFGFLPHAAECAVKKFWR